MTKLGSDKRPAVVHVPAHKRAEDLLSICNHNGWKVIIGLESDKPEILLMSNDF